MKTELFENKEAKAILAAFHKCSDEILQEEFLEQQYKKNVKKNTESYLRNFL